MGSLMALDSVMAGQQKTLSQTDRERLKDAAADFEAIFLKQMMTSMRRTVPKVREGEEALFKESEGEKIFRDLLDGEYAKVLSRRERGGLGLKEAILKHAPNRAPSATVQRKGSVQEKNGSDPQADLLRLKAQSSLLNALGQMPVKAQGGGR